jgi:restriction endonuclease S subunit
MVRPYLKNIAIVNYEHCIASSGFYVCRSDNFLFPRYCYYLMISDYVVYGLNKSLKGDNSPSISRRDIETWTYPVPPLSEQKKIAKKLDILFSQIDIIEQNEKSLEQIIQYFKSTILRKAINGHLGTHNRNDEPASELLKSINPNFKPCDNSHYKKIPVHWELCYLQDVCKIERGVTFPASAKSLYHGTNMIPCIRTANVQDRLDLSDLWYIDKSYMKGNLNKLVKKDDIILSSANSRELVGKTSYICKDEGEITFGGFVLKIRSRGIDPKYLFFFLRYTYLSNIFKNIASQTTNIANISTLSLSNLIIAVPPLAEQKRISQTVKNFFTPLEKCVFDISDLI